tara:strand:- start:4297 stop:5034 length:738 start_codon:yes stop_codon:yes gene_type:complete
MKDKLIIVGGSFGRTYQYKRNLSDTSKRWANILANKLNLIEKNYCRVGCSIEYTRHELFKYIKSKEYNKKDIIIFLLPGDFGSPVIEPSFHPEWAGSMHRYLRGGKIENKEIYNHYKRFKSFYTYLVTWAFEEELIESKIFYILSTLKSLPNLTLLIPSDNDEIANKVKLIVKDDDNNICLKETLLDISRAEYSDGLWEDRLRKDYRANHLSEPNHIILANELHKVIINKSSKEFQINNFEKNIL